MDPLSTTFAALADPTRRAILARLAQGETHVGELIKPFAISGPAISRHLKVLEEAALITRTRRSQQFVCRLNPEGLKSAQEWLDALDIIENRAHPPGHRGDGPSAAMNR